MSVTLVAGSRTITDEGFVFEALDNAYNAPHMRIITEVIQGKAPGVDRLAARWAKRNGLPWIDYGAQWELHGKAAGFIRNQRMVDVSEQAVVIWDGESRGTKHTLGLLVKAKKPFVLFVAPLETTQALIALPEESKTRA